MFCTIITANYAHYALALHDSLIQFNRDIEFSVFISQGNLSETIESELVKRPNIKTYYFDDLAVNSLVKDLKGKYYHEYHDAYRWGMKPLFLEFLLKTYDKVIYLDSDLYFFNDYEFLFDNLEKANVLLTPHWRSANPDKEYSNFVHNFRDGLYNAGFIGASRGAEKALEWWAKMVLFKCEVNRKDGYYVDQRYLDLMPVIFEDVEVLKHKGCNVANWNQVICERTPGKDGEVLINHQFPIVFIHFTNTMLTGIFYENDKLLKPYLEKYRDQLLKYSDIDIIEDYYEKGRFKKSRSENDFKKKNKKKGVVDTSKSFLNKIYRKLS
ncbi:hypothetical protein [Christiangramia sp. SM2212]|uniref:Glycosyltransferase n=1 Tax=Christiangramia sediminicola TaxID=3073267 RepID=A0ABU1EMU5_9FLAO|nr:hypothetical protein [Christiangramia sp. SM2212]MDR5589699.1 hypothetical protein [Christiangramia sp. SM2212]